MHGCRIELGEIEAVLSQHPDVQEAVVLAREDVPGDKRLVAYVVPRREQELVPSQLRTLLRQQLPAYMVPAAFVTLDRLPHTPNGKLDRRALPAPGRDRSAVDETYIPARTPIEAELVQIWRDILGIAQVGVYDNFFALGGHSLLATRVIARIDYAFAIQLPLQAIFEAPTVADLAENVMQKGMMQVEDDELRRLMAEVEELPAVEVRRLLSDESG
jgi:acyl carrier protein